MDESRGMGSSVGSSVEQWEQHVDPESGRYYYVSSVTGQSRWEAPVPVSSTAQTSTAGTSTARTSTAGTSTAGTAAGTGPELDVSERVSEWGVSE